jgi:uncharacterized coiled-coil DUF342 family protein
MKGIIEKVNEWLDETIKTKKALNKTIRGLENHIDEMLEKIEDYKTAKNYAVNQMNKYKTQLSELNKKYCELEINKNEIEAELKKEIRSLKRENKKLEKELCTNAITVDVNSGNQEK